MRNELFDMLNMDSLKTIYIVSNTPMYLYKNFRKDASVQELSNRYSADELIDLFYQIMGDMGKEIEQLTTLYAIMMSLTYKECQQAKVFFETQELYDIEWFEEFRDIYFSTSRITEVHEVKGNQAFHPV